MAKTTHDKAPVRLVYCGPTIPKVALAASTVYKGGYPEHLAGAFEKCPAIKELFVPVVELGSARQAIETKGSRMNTLYKEVLQFIQEGGV